LKRLQHRLAAVYSIFSTGYGPEVTQEIITPLRSPIKNLIRPISARVADINAIRASFPEGKRIKLKKLRRLTAVVRPKRRTGESSKGAYEGIPVTQNLLGSQLMEELMDELVIVRQRLWEKKNHWRGENRTEMFRFYGIIHAMEEFVQIWEGTIQIASSANIKKEFGADALLKSDEDYLKESTLHMYEGAGKTIETAPMSHSVLDQFVGAPDALEPDDDDIDEIHETVGLKEQTEEMTTIDPGLTIELEIEELRQATEAHEENEEEILQQQNKGGYFA